MLYRYRYIKLQRHWNSYIDTTILLLAFYCRFKCNRGHTINEIKISVKIYGFQKKVGDFDISVGTKTLHKFQTGVKVFLRGLLSQNSSNHSARTHISRHPGFSSLFVQQFSSTNTRYQNVRHLSVALHEVHTQCTRTTDATIGVSLYSRNAGSRFYRGWKSILRGRSHRYSQRFSSFRFSSVPTRFL